MLPHISSKSSSVAKNTSLAASIRLPTDERLLIRAQSTGRLYREGNTRLCQHSTGHLHPTYCLSSDAVQMSRCILIPLRSQRPGEYTEPEVHLFVWNRVW